MTQELADKIIAHYEMVIEKIKDMTNIITIQIILDKAFVDLGICSCANKQFGEDIYNDKWVNSFKQIENCQYWFKVIPCVQHKKEDILTSLQLRVDRLKTFKES